MVRATKDAMGLKDLSVAHVWCEAHEIRGRWTKEERFCRALEAQRLQHKLLQSLTSITRIGQALRVAPSAT